MRCTSCLEYFPRPEIYSCCGCKMWFCSACQADHAPCGEDAADLEPESDDEAIAEIDDSGPGIWIIQEPSKEEFSLWNYCDKIAV